MPQFSMVIQLGKAQILEGHVFHVLQRGFNIRRAAADVFQKRSEPVFGHC
jgi:hypothetical protein